MICRPRFVSILPLAIGPAIAGAAFATALLCSAGAASAGEFALGLSAGALGQGAQGTVKGGAMGGGLLELRSSDRYEFDLGFSYGRDPGGGSNQNPRVTLNALTVQARRIFGSRRLRPYLDVGLAWYGLDYESTDASNPFDSSVRAVGGPVGAGAAMALSDRVNMRLGVEYHMIAAEPTYETGNLEDYFWIGAAFTVRFSGE